VEVTYLSDEEIKEMKGHADLIESSHHDEVSNRAPKLHHFFLIFQVLLLTRLICPQKETFIEINQNDYYSINPFFREVFVNSG